MPSNDAQRHSASFLLAADDKDFILSDEMRPLRFAMEYAKAELALRKACICSTVVVFGSARIPSPEQLAKLGNGDDREFEAVKRRAAYYEKARAFAHLVSLRGGALGAAQGCAENV